MQNQQPPAPGRLQTRIIDIYLGGSTAALVSNTTAANSLHACISVIIIITIIIIMIIPIFLSVKIPDESPPPFRTALQQGHRGVARVLAQRQQQRRHALGVGAVQLRPAVHQSGDGHRVARGHRQSQGRLAVLVLRVGVGACAARARGASV